MRELPEPDHKAQCDGMLWPDAYSPELVLAIQKQAYEDGLRDAGKDTEPSMRMLRAMNGGRPMTLEQASKMRNRYFAMLTASQKEQQ